MRYALSNYAKNRMISRSLWNEIMVYASLQRQVYKAFEIVGVKNYKGRIIVISDDENKNYNPKITINKEKLSYWNISDPLDILEKMAIFHTENF